jgi:sugar O-acyltransferase (sialic acid O-acetyltransferase NeuD family)
MQIMNRPVLTEIKHYDTQNLIPSLVVALGDNFLRGSTVSQLQIQNPGYRFPSLVHPSATVSHGAQLGDGVLVFPGARVGACTEIGNFVVLNTNASVDHDSKVEDFASLAPGAVTGGNVFVGERSAILISASVSHGVKIGRDTLIAANSFLKQDTGNLEVWMGTPAKLHRNRVLGEHYL